MPLSAVRPSHVKAWCSRLRGEGKAASYVYALHSRLAQIMGDAVHDGIVPRSPCSRRTSPGGGKQRPFVTDNVDSWFVPQVGLKASDTARASTVTLANDPDIAVPLAANAVYRVTGMLLYTGDTAGTAIAYAWTFPSGALGRYLATYTAGALTSGLQWSDTPSASSTVSSSNIMYIGIAGIIQTFAASGTLQLQWAQGTSSATATTLKVRSFLQATRIG